MKKQWLVANPDQKSIHTLAKELGCSGLLAKLLVLRGITSKEQAIEFLHPSLGALTAPLQLAGMKTAVVRVHQALVHDEKIIVFGDYDTDGVTATAVLVSFLRSCGATVRYAIPYRPIDGYGLNVRFIQKRALPAGAKLIITVDCGSGSNEAISYAKKVGIDTIVTDHHRVRPLSSDAVSIVNPTRNDCTADLDHLAGVGVAFYLVIALRSHLREKKFWKNRKEPNLKNYCDLVALGTVADISPIVHENRILTTAGLHQMNQSPRPGISALVRMGRVSEAPVRAETISFQLAPRLNAAGRLAHSRIASELLLANNRQKADRLAKALCRLNSKRQHMENDLLQTILSQLKNDPHEVEGPVLVVHGENWHEGVIGIVAARLVRMFHRPSIVISTCDGTGKGSGRSIEGIDLSFALQQCADLLDRYGGHPMAAGLSLPDAKLQAFKIRLTKVVNQLYGSIEPHAKKIIDARVSICEITPSVMSELERLEPFGRNNPYPQFVDHGVRVLSSNRIGNEHCKMVLESPACRGIQKTALQFNTSAQIPAKGDVVSIVYRPQWNYWKGSRHLQLLVEDIAPALSEPNTKVSPSFF